MNLSTCLQHFQSMGLSVRGRLAYGVISEYPLFLQFQGSGETVNAAILRIQLQDTMDKRTRKDLKNVLKKQCQLVFTGHTLQMTIRMSKDDTLTACETVMLTAINFLQSNMIAPSQLCPICHQANCDSAVFFQGVFQKAHRQCITSSMEQITQKTESNQNNGSYLLGLIGALLGGIVGILPSILSILFAERIYVLLYALIPICIYWGYRLLKGKMTRSVIVITIILSVLYLFIMEFILLVIGVYNEYGLLLIRECFELFVSPDGFREIISDMPSSFLFLALGIIYSWRMITETNAGINSNAEFTMATLTPLYPAAQNEMAAMEESKNGTL